MPFTPDRFFTRVTQIDIEHDIVSRGVKCVLIDLDNTLLPRDTHQVPDDIRAWLKALSAAGVRVCILTNNWHHGAHEWAQRLGLPLCRTRLSRCRLRMLLRCVKWARAAARPCALAISS